MYIFPDLLGHSYPFCLCNQQLFFFHRCMANWYTCIMWYWNDSFSTGKFSYVLNIRLFLPKKHVWHKQKILSAPSRLTIKIGLARRSTQLSYTRWHFKILYDSPYTNSFLSILASNSAMGWLNNIIQCGLDTVYHSVYLVTIFSHSSCLKVLSECMHS